MALTQTQKMAKIYLSRARWLRVKIEALRETRKRVMKDTGSDYAPEHIVYNSEKEKAGLKAATLAQKIDGDIERLTVLKDEIYEAISSIHDDELETILIYRYLNFMTYEQIARKIRYCDVRSVQRKHDKALEIVGKKLS